ncbi:acyltransferase family protein [Mesorhizobium sp. 113-3-3]|uniref:acyltransferase family protein n=1 Tax=Mesorhizobium sp. 113-3-3 TaxID=2744516 RepID=UPI0018EC6CB4|nr:acyltransferase [Mesorhizobium sp. 113-3-3]
MEQEARLSGLDELRGLAIGLVVLSHVGPVFAEGGTAAALLFAPAWSVGVDLFFVISGLVVERSLRSLRHERGALEATSAFYVRRAMRIVPLAWFVGTILSIGLLLPGSGIEPEDAKAAFAFISNVHWAPCFGGAAGCGNAFAFAPFWSVAGEVQFYLLAPLLVLMLPRRALVALAGLVLVVGAFTLRPWGGTLWTFRIDAIAVGLAIGAIMGTTAWPRLAEHLRVIGNMEAAFWMSIAAFMLAILPPATHGVATAVLALMCGWIVARATLRGGSVAWPGRMLRRLGGISYALYLIHLPVLALFKWSLGQLLGAPATATLSIASAIGLSHMLTAVMGNPLRQLGRQWSNRTVREVSP